MRVNRPARGLALVLLLALASAACATSDPPVAAPGSPQVGGGHQDATGGTAPVSASDEPPHDFTTFRGEGEMTTEKALQVFALAFGPVPGVEPPTDPALAFPGGTQTGVVLDVVERFDDLTLEQRHAVRDYLLPPESTGTDPSDGSAGTAPTTAVDGPEGSGQPMATPAALLLPGTLTPRQVEALVQRAVGEIQSHTGSTVTPLTEIDFPGTDTLDSEGSWAVAEAYLDVVRDEPALLYVRLDTTKCRIHIGNNVLRAADQEQAYASIAHEVFHCFQYKTFDGMGATFLERPPWVIEGGAAWVGEELAGGSGIAIAQSWWRNYLAGAGDGSYLMFANDGYAAIGFWEHVDTAGGDAWSKVLAAIQSADDATAFTYVTGDSRSVLAGWASSTVRQDWAPDGEWQLDVTRQRPTDGHRTPAVGSLDSGDNEVAVPAGGQLVRHLVPGDGVEFAVVQLSAPTTISWIDSGPGASTASATGSKPYCLIDDCLCPDGSLPFDGGFTAVGSGRSLMVGVSGTGSAASKVKIEGLSKEDVCEPCPGTASGMRAPSGFTATQGSDGTCPDRCLIGKWTLDTADLASQAGSVLSGSEVTITGSVVLDLDGTRSVVTYADEMTAVRPMDAGLVMTLHFAWAGTATGSYTGAVGNITATEESNDVVETITGDINGSPMPTTGMDFADGGSVFGGAATYQCSGGTLVTQSEGTPFHHTWHRINSPG